MCIRDSYERAIPSILRALVRHTLGVAERRPDVFGQRGAPHHRTALATAVRLNAVPPQVAIVRRGVDAPGVRAFAMIDGCIRCRHIVERHVKEAVGRVGA